MLVVSTPLAIYTKAKYDLRREFLTLFSQAKIKNIELMEVHVTGEVWFLKFDIYIEQNRNPLPCSWSFRYGPFIR